MVERGAMTILALDRRVMCRVQFSGHVVMAVAAVAAVLVLAGEFLPYLFVAEAMEAEGVAAVLGAEVLGHVKRPEDQDAGYQAEDHEEWSPYMIFHCLPPTCNF